MDESILAPDERKLLLDIVNRIDKAEKEGENRCLIDEQPERITLYGLAAAGPGFVRRGPIIKEISAEDEMNIFPHILDNYLNKYELVTVERDGWTEWHCYITKPETQAMYFDHVEQLIEQRLIEERKAHKENYRRWPSINNNNVAPSSIGEEVKVSNHIFTDAIKDLKDKGIIAEDDGEKVINRKRCIYITDDYWGTLNERETNQPQAEVAESNQPTQIPSVYSNEASNTNRYRYYPMAQKLGELLGRKAGSIEGVSAGQAILAAQDILSDSVYPFALTANQAADAVTMGLAATNFAADEISPSTIILRNVLKIVEISVNTNIVKGLVEGYVAKLVEGDPVLKQEVLQVIATAPWDENSLLLSVEEMIKSLQAKIPNIDPLIIAYLKEAAKCFDADSVLGAALLVGGASERAINLLVDSYTEAIAKQANKNKMVSRTSRQPISVIYEEFKHSFLSSASQMNNRDEQRHNIEKIDSLFDYYRLCRNEAGHPRVPPNLDKTAIKLSIAHFSTYVQAIYRLMEYFASTAIT